MSILYAKGNSITDLKSYDIISPYFLIKEGQWMRIIIGNDIKKANPVICYINGIRIANIEKPPNLLKTNGIYFMRLNHGLAYYRQIRLWKSTIISSMNFFDEYNDLLDNIPIQNLLFYVKLDEANGTLIYDKVTNITISTDLNPNINVRKTEMIWGSLDNCGTEKYLRNNTCMLCPINCLSCGVDSNLTLNCYICKKGFLLNNNKCKNSVQRGMSIISNQPKLLYKRNDTLSEFTVVFQIKINNYLKLLNSSLNNTFIKFDNFYFYVNSYNLLEFYTPDNSKSNLNTSLDLNWNTIFFSFTNITFKLEMSHITKLDITIYEELTFNTIYLNENSLVLLKGLQIFSKKLSLMETLYKMFR